MCLKFNRLLSDLLLVAGILCCCAIIFSCKDDSDTVEIPIPEGETLSVALTIDFSNEADGYATHTRGVDNEQNDVFEAKPNVVSSTRSSGVLPMSLYNLEIRQYDQNGKYLNGQSLGNTIIGSKITVPLTATKENEDCQLLIVARGDGNTIGELGGKSLSAVQTDITATSTKIEAIDPSVEMKTMPYMLHLPHVKVVADAANTGKGIIRSSENGTEDVRLRLKRLVARVTLNWTLSDAMKTQGYELKEVKLCQIPKQYYLFPASENTEWGTTYPSTVSEFVDIYRLTDTDLTTANGSKSVWVPANVRGTSSASTAPIHRTKENAPTAASYAEIVVDNADKKERLYYRAYLGGNDPSDFNLNENTDYNWTLNIKSADYTGDPRIELLDQTPVQSESLVPTANCLMLQPGGNLCFNPYQHTAGTNGWNDQLVNNPSTSPAIKTAITSVKVLWQTKDAGTSGDLVLGYIIDDTHHENLANIMNAGDINQARVHVKAPVTQGGNAVIAAYNGNTILWSWHVWVTDYVPVGLKGIIDSGTRATAISNAQTATRNGAVQVYQGISWTDPAGSFYKCVIMDRNLGATRAGIQKKLVDAVRTFGLLYQGGRKDPFFSTADGTPSEVKTIFDGYGKEVALVKSKTTATIDITIQNPQTYYSTLNGFSNAWGGDGNKTMYDPCPDGWRIPSNEYLTNVGKGGKGFTWQEGDRLASLFAGFGHSDVSYVHEGYISNYLYDENLMYYNGESFTRIGNTSLPSSTVVGSGYLYLGGSGENTSNYSSKSAYFPGVSLREGSGGYRASTRNNTVFLWSSTTNGGAMHMYEIQYDPSAFGPSGKLGLLGFQHPNSYTYGFSVRCVQDNIQPR